eukprot:gb/GEZN01008126.1/.p1 GENE.gb/GEZN01008126.1/~~gb/GEZN01008126.1/.p1  ORF type:complete len:457 (-),score=55.12 gb/GEZN01008126.1/:18-1388(-)
MGIKKKSLSQNGSPRSLFSPAFLAGLLFGTVTPITSKLLYEVTTLGADGEITPFTKPWFKTLTMFSAMTMALMYFAFWRAFSPLSVSVEDWPDRSILLSMLFPAFFDLLATSLLGIGLIFTSLSVCQMLRGALIIFSATLSWLFLGNKIYGFQWVGCLLCTTGVGMVGAAGLLTSQDRSSRRSELLGISLLLLAQLAQAMQLVIEEKFLHKDKAPALVVVGMEGLWGSLLMMFVFLPACWVLPGNDVGGHYENFYDSLVKLYNSSAIRLILGAYWLAVLGYNVCGIWVTQSFSAVHHTLMEGFRTLTVWAVELLLFYAFEQHQYGEAWSRYSWLQLAGFLVMIGGTLVYQGQAVLPCFDYTEWSLGETSQDFKEEAEQEEPTEEEGRDREEGEWEDEEGEEEVAWEEARSRTGGQIQGPTERTPLVPPSRTSSASSLFSQASQIFEEQTSIGMGIF